MGSVDLAKIKRVASTLDLSVLGAGVQKSQIDEILRVAVATGCATIAINPCYVKYAAGKMPNGYTRLCSVVGFPFGQNSTAAKIADARQAVDDGAQELDMVANVGFFKDGRDAEVRDEIERVVKIAAGRTVKVIIESCHLDKDELARISDLVATAGANFVKTSSGFNTAGGTLEEVRIMLKAVRGRCGVKISGLGGGLTFEQAVQFLDAGATRIGTRLGCPMMDTIRKAMGVD
jgi:deoxyribose-phosphate aldolase